MDGYLNIYGNGAVTSLDGLNALTSVVGGVHIYENAALPDCEACDLLDQLATAPVPIDVHDNQSDACTPVPANCP